MAQIVTITNPLTGQPTQVDQLEHTAQQIDDAIARSLPGGDIDTLLAGKAPAGYGLGTIGKRLYSSDDLNTIWKSGFYCWGGSDKPTNFIENAPSAFWVSVMEVISYGDGGVNIQRVWGLDTTSAPILVQRVKYGNTIRPWEYVNPPMQVGDEYRTTERYLGKPVYVRTKEFSALAIGSSSSPARTDITNFTEACDKIARYEMYVTPASGGAKYPIPFIDATTGVLKASGSLNEGQYLYGSIYSFDNLSGYKANVTCWYTKTTD